MSYSGSSSVLSALSENWWALALRGLAAVLFGLLAFVLPGLTVTALVLLFGAYALVDGVFALVSGIRGAGGRRWVLIVEGVLGIVAGLLTFAWPGITALVLLYLIAFWAIFTGVVEIAAAVALRREIEGEWALILAGIVSVVFGIVLAVLPGVGLISLVWLVGIYALMFGVALIVLAFRVRGSGGTRSSRVA